MSKTHGPECCCNYCDPAEAVFPPPENIPDFIPERPLRAWRITYTSGLVLEIARVRKPTNYAKSWAVHDDSGKAYHYVIEEIALIRPAYEWGQEIGDDQQ